MKVKEAITLFQYYQRSSHKERTTASYLHLLKKFESLYGERPFDSIEPDEIYHFLETLTQDHAKSSRRLRYAQLKAFYNFIITRCSLDMKNPRNAPLLSKTFRMPKAVSRKILDKEVVDEMIYNTQSLRDRLMLELQARCGLKDWRVFKDQSLGHLREENNSKRTQVRQRDEVAFMPEPVAKRLNDYIKDQGLQSNDRLFPICYSTARYLIKRLSSNLHIRLTPHDLRRYSATYASRNGVP